MLYFAIPFLTLVVMLEATVLPQVQVGNALPDLTMLAVAAWSLRRGVDEGAVWAFFAGAVFDLVSGGPVPSAIFALLLVSLALGIDPGTGMGRRQGRPFGGNPVALIFGIVLATLIYHAVLLMALELAGRPFDWLVAGRDVVLPHVLANLVLIPVVYYLLGWLDRRTRPEELSL